MEYYNLQKTWCNDPAFQPYFALYFLQSTNWKWSFCQRFAEMFCVFWQLNQDQSGCHLGWITNTSLQEIVYTKVGSSITIPPALSHFKYVSFYSFSYTIMSNKQVSKTPDLPLPRMKAQLSPSMSFLTRLSFFFAFVCLWTHHIISWTSRSLPHTTCTFTLSLRREPDATSR